MKTPVFANEKGCALLAAIDSGLIPEQNGPCISGVRGVRKGT